MTGTYVSLAVGVNSLTGGALTNALGFGGDGGRRAQQAVDPFSSYRGKLGQMYSGYLTGKDQTDITQMPGFSQFQTGVMNPALEASKRASAASGMLMSGNEQIALQDIGQQGYYGFMTDYLNRLATGSGAGYSPSEGGKAGIAQGNLQDRAQMEAIGGVSRSLAEIYGRNQSSAGNTMSNAAGYRASDYGAYNNYNTNNFGIGQSTLYGV